MSCFVHQSSIETLGSKDGDGGKRQPAARHLHPYNNWSSNFSLLIGRELWSIRIQIMEMMWWWHNFFLFLSLTSRLTEKLCWKWTERPVNVIWKNQHFSKAYTLIDHRIDIETLQWKHSLAAQGSTWILNILTSFPWSITAQTMVNSCQFVNFLS